MVNNLLKNLKLQFNKLIDLKFFISTVLSTLGTRVSIAKFNVNRSLLAEAALFLRRSAGPGRKWVRRPVHLPPQVTNRNKYPYFFIDRAFSCSGSSVGTIAPLAWSNRCSTLEQLIVMPGTTLARWKTRAEERARVIHRPSQQKILRPSTSHAGAKKCSTVLMKPRMEQEDEAVVGGLVCSMGRTESMPWAVFYHLYKKTGAIPIGFLRRNGTVEEWATYWAVALHDGLLERVWLLASWALRSKFW
jgi:hypothetical protein